MSGNRFVENSEGAQGSKRSPHTIRFLDAEWDRIVEFAEARGITPAEFVRSATLSMMDQGDTSMASLAELIKHTFRASYISATILRDEMLDGDDSERVEELVQAARGLQARLLGEDQN